jgi:hypothetical protein
MLPPHPFPTHCSCSCLSNKTKLLFTFIQLWHYCRVQAAALVNPTRIQLLLQQTRAQCLRRLFDGFAPGRWLLDVVIGSWDTGLAGLRDWLNGQ